MVVSFIYQEHLSILFLIGTLKIQITLIRYLIGGTFHLYLKDKWRY